LHELLSRAGVTPPYILVGASAGGFPVLVYAGLFPDEIAGVVLVDSSHPDQDSRAHAPQDPAGYIRKWEPFLGLMHRTGILRLGMRRETRPAAFSTDRWDEVLYLCERPNSYHALLREGAAWVESAKQVRASGGLGKKPLVVLTGSRDADAKWRSIWIDGLQAELARLSTRGKQVVLDGSGHGIQFDAPGAVVDAIREISSVTGGA
jgi:pimeloyl-ACP methyl ester carboxylesterase